MSNPIADPFVEVSDTDTQSPLVRIEATEDGAVTVMIDRADKENALNGEVVAALREAFETLAGADGVRVVFVTGAGGNFSTGEDADWIRELGDLSEADNRDDAMQMAIMLKHLHDLPALTVALVDGVAFGAGAGLVAACNLGIATHSARFAFSEVKLGLIPAATSPYIVAAIGARRARGLFASGGTFDADQAREIGLIDEIVGDAGGLIAVRDRIALDIQTCAPGAVAEAKKLVSVVTNREIDHGMMEDTSRRIARIRLGEEGREGVKAFLDNRKPGWAL